MVTTPEEANSYGAVGGAVGRSEVLQATGGAAAPGAGCAAGQVEDVCVLRPALTVSQRARDYHYQPQEKPGEGIYFSIIIITTITGYYYFYLLLLLQLLLDFTSQHYEK